MGNAVGIIDTAAVPFAVGDEEEGINVGDVVSVVVPVAVEMTVGADDSDNVGITIGIIVGNE